LRVFPPDDLLELIPTPRRVVETLGEASNRGWRLTARCAAGKQDGMHRHRECVYRAELDLRTLIWTRGRDFPLSRLESRLKCPRCGSRQVVVMYSVPSEPSAQRAMTRQ
jgi:hypothetical protein